MTSRDPDIPLRWDDFIRVSRSQEAANPPLQRRTRRNDPLELDE